MKDIISPKIYTYAYFILALTLATSTLSNAFSSAAFDTNGRFIQNDGATPFLLQKSTSSTSASCSRIRGGSCFGRCLKPIFATTEKTLSCAGAGTAAGATQTLEDEAAKSSEDMIQNVIQCQKSDASDDNRNKAAQHDGPDEAREEKEEQESDGTEMVGDGDDGDDGLEQRRRAAIAATLMKRGKPMGSSNRSRNKSISESRAKRAAEKSTTSVGTRRESSATKSRAASRAGVGSSLSGRLLGGVRTSAAVAAAARQKSNQNNSNNDGNSNDNGKDCTDGRSLASTSELTSSSLPGDKKNIIQSTIDAIIDAQNEIRSFDAPSITNIGMGLLGERNAVINTNAKRDTINARVEARIQGPTSLRSPNLEISNKPRPGTVLVHSRQTNLDRKRISDGGYNTHPMTIADPRERIRTHMSVRTATVADDMEIAKLRLSVFSDFSPEVRRQFRQRSCEVLNNRRMEGATCLVASVNYNDVDVTDSQMDTDDIDDIEDNVDVGVNGLRKSRTASSAHSWIIGSVECSTHEFAGTILGRRKPGGSVLYVTEVAVSPRARRLGAGTILLKGINELAAIRNVETIYLHVDVSNAAACKLYKKAGYEILDSQNPIYAEFTTKLNLHDGATKGRVHHLMHKKVTDHQTWLESDSLDEKGEGRSGTLGFEVPDFV